MTHRGPRKRATSRRAPRKAQRASGRSPQADTHAHPAGAESSPRDGDVRGAPGAGAILAWLGPLVLLSGVALGVWFFAFRETPAERVEELMTEAREAMALYEHSRAEQLLLEAIDTLPESPILHHNLAALYVRLERWDDARLAFERSASLMGPEANEVLAEELFQVSTMNMRLTRYEEAERALEQAITAHPMRRILHTRLLDLQLGYLRNAERADSTTSRFLRLFGRTPENLRDAAWVHYRRNSFVTAIELARAAADQVDSMLTAHVIVAKSYWKAARPDEGLVYIAGPLTRYPNDPSLWVARGALQVGKGTYDAALESLDRALEIDPSYYEAHQARMMALFNADRLEESLEQARVCHGMTDNENERRFLESHIRRVQDRLKESESDEPEAEAR